jgi:hypothetical protein
MAVMTEESSENFAQRTAHVGLSLQILETSVTTVKTATTQLFGGNRLFAGNPANNTSIWRNLNLQVNLVNDDCRHVNQIPSLVGNLLLRRAGFLQRDFKGETYALVQLHTKLGFR